MMCLSSLRNERLTLIQGDREATPNNDREATPNNDRYSSSRENIFQNHTDVYDFYDKSFHLNLM